MNVQTSHPTPDIPDQGPASPPTPIVYESEEYQWQYKYIRQNLDEEGPLGETRLNELGKEGWELVTVITLSDNSIHYYFKRLTS